MARYTRGQLDNIIQNNIIVKDILKSKGGNTQTAINCLMSDLVAKGLSFREDKLNVRSSGRAEHTYDGNELVGYLGGYLAGVEDHKMSLKKAIVLSITEHFKLLGYDSISKTRKVSKTQILREFIFGKANSDKYYASE